MILDVILNEGVSETKGVGAGLPSVRVNMGTPFADCRLSPALKGISRPKCVQPQTREAIYDAGEFGRPIAPHLLMQALQALVMGVLVWVSSRQGTWSIPTQGERLDVRPRAGSKGVKGSGEGQIPHARSSNACRWQDSLRSFHPPPVIDSTLPSCLSTPYQLSFLSFSIDAHPIKNKPRPSVQG